VGRDGSVVYAVNSAGKVYVTNSGDGTVSVYQAPDLSPLGRITVNGMPHGLRPAAGGSMIVVANTSAGALDLIDPATDRYIGTVPVGTGPAQDAVSADGTYAYTGISEPPSIVKVDLSQRRVVGSAPVPHSPVQVYLTPDEKTVLSANQGTRAMPGDTVSVIDTAEMTSRATVTTGAGPHGVVIDAAGTWAWVTNSYADTVTPIDLSRMAASTPIPVGTGPNGISYSARAPAAAPTDVITLQIPAPAARGPQPTDNGAHSGHGH
jgi:YVTN family beta-propeller protein